MRKITFATKACHASKIGISNLLLCYLKEILGNKLKVIWTNP